MQLPTLLLCKKELRQNAVLYFLPLPFALALIYLKFLGTVFPEWMGSILGLAIPFTLAVAYGLQGFDVEEDAQTRDFLLVKPLSLWRIVGEKFLIGLGFLLCWVMIAVWGAIPNLSWPTIASMGTWVPALIILGSIMAYGTSFFTGLWISGPKKLLFSSVLSLFGMTWGFFTLSCLATFFTQSQAVSQFQLIQDILFYLSGLMIVTVFIVLLIFLSVWFLLQRPQLNEFPRLSQLIVIAIFLPIFAVTLNFSVQPPIRPAYFYGFGLLEMDSPFWAVDGAWQPNGDTIALADDQNRIALGRLGQKPHVIYSFPKDQRNLLKDLNWSPDGKRIVFNLKDQIYFMNIRDKKPIWVGKGFAPNWSRNSDAILFSREDAKPQIQNTAAGRLRIYNIDFFIASAKRFLVKPAFKIQSISHCWIWDSNSDALLVLDPFGRLIVYGSNQAEVLPLPVFDARREGIIWGRFYPFAKDSNRTTLSLYSTEMPVIKGRPLHYTARFYSIDLGTKKVSLLGSRSKTVLSNLIFDPKSGTILWGHGTTYLKDRVRPEDKGVKP